MSFSLCPVWRMHRPLPRGSQSWDPKQIEVSSPIHRHPAAPFMAPCAHSWAGRLKGEACFLSVMEARSLRSRFPPGGSTPLSQGWGCCHPGCSLFCSTSLQCLLHLHMAFSSRSNFSLLEVTRSHWVRGPLCARDLILTHYVSSDPVFQMWVTLGSPGGWNFHKGGDTAHPITFFQFSVTPF